MKSTRRLIHPFHRDFSYKIFINNNLSETISRTLCENILSRHKRKQASTRSSKAKIIANLIETLIFIDRARYDLGHFFDDGLSGRTMPEYESWRREELIIQEARRGTLMSDWLPASHVRAKVIDFARLSTNRS